MKKIISVIGARPQFIKHAPVQLELQKYYNALTVHTGQHYDESMSNVFFQQFKMAKPDYLFDIGGVKTHGEQTGIMLTEIEKVFLKEQPDAVLIYGDTNSTLAGVLAAIKIQIPVIHIEAGLRSYNRTMPEEINRIVADQFSKLLFCPTKTAIENLAKEGINHDNIFLCGDVMCDTLKMVEDKATPRVKEKYYFATIHRPYNTDNKEKLEEILNALNRLDHKVIFSVHPRTISKMRSHNLEPSAFSNINFIGPVGYLESISFQKYAEAVITDSGGIQKEAYMLKKKCITIRSETEWVETLESGWNQLLFTNLQRMQECINTPYGDKYEEVYGNGKAAGEIVGIIKNFI